MTRLQRLLSNKINHTNICIQCGRERKSGECWWCGSEEVESEEG